MGFSGPLIHNIYIYNMYGVHRVYGRTSGLGSRVGVESVPKWCHTTPGGQCTLHDVVNFQDQDVQLL